MRLPASKVFLLVAVLTLSSWLSVWAAPQPQAVTPQATPSVDTHRDITPPSVSFSLPQGRQPLTYLPNIFGRVSDNPNGSGVARVVVRLQRTTNGKVFYWSGARWRTQPIRSLNTDNVWGLADVFGNRWRYGDLPSRYIRLGGMGIVGMDAQLFSGSYTFTATAYDRAGNFKSAAMTLKVAADTIAPTITFSQPHSGAVIRALPVISGSVTDKGGSAPYQVWVSILRRRDEKWWTGSEWATQNCPEPPQLPALLSRGRWQLTGELPTAANLTNGRYSLQVVAYDRAGNRTGRRWLALKDGGETTTDVPASIEIYVRRKRAFKPRHRRRTQHL